MCQVAFLDAFIRSFAGCQVHIDRISDSHPGRARNRAAANFLATDCDYLLFIDSDIIFSRQHIEWLNESAEPVLAGIYCLKQREIKPCFVTLPGFQPTATGGYIKVKRTGTGFLRIHRSVFEALKSEAIRYTNHGRDEWDFFRSGVSDGEWLSEDWFFCDEVRRVGFDVVVDTRIQLGHEGKIVYPLHPVPDRLAVCPPEMKEFIEDIWQGEYAIETGRPPRTVLDLGANIGGFTVWAKEKWPDATVRAFEPHPDNAALYRINTRHFRGVKLENVAVAGLDGETRLAEGATCGEHSLKMSGAGRAVRVLNAEHVPSAEFVKIDTEGCEVEILENLDLTETQWIALEYHSNEDCGRIREILSGEFKETKYKPVAAGRGLLHFTRKPNA